MRAASQSEANAAASAAAAERHGRDACALLSAPVIEKTLGEPVQQTSASSGRRGAVIDCQCLYLLPTFSNSISLSLSLPDPASKHLGPREVWRQRFHEVQAKQEEAASEPEKEREAALPVPVSGLGEEAFWVRSFVGTLYVLKGNAFLRISLGGKWDDATRLKRAQLLARNALAAMGSAGIPGENASSYSAGPRSDEAQPRE